MTREEAIDTLTLRKDCYDELSEALAMAIEALSADAEPTVIRSKTLMPTKDFNEWAKRVRETNPNVIVIPCDAEVVSDETVQGEWVDTGNWMGIECSRCKCHSRYITPFCQNCGAKMTKGGDSE